MPKKQKPIPRIPPPLKRGPKPSCECGVCETCLNRIRVLRNYYKSKFGENSPEYKEMTGNV
jgi:hypothetical protein